MKQGIFTIVSNEALTDVVYKMILEGDTSAITRLDERTAQLQLLFSLLLSVSFLIAGQLS